MRNFPDFLCRIETARFGPFDLRVGVERSIIAMLLQRVEDAHQRFITSPLSQVANQIEKEVVVSSIFGTNTIEGGELSEEETGQVLEMDPAQVQAKEQRRVVNLSAAYQLAQREASQKDWRLTENFMLEMHRTICQGLDDARYHPGELRSNPKNQATVVGDRAHGGRYKPPQFSGDISALLTALVDWHDQLVESDIPALIRAPLVHLYFELIHPFWDGNGRVGRAVEAAVLHAAGYRYAPFALARYYYEHIDQYFALFNLCRKQAEKGDVFPNTPFVSFHLEGMLEAINKLHDRVNRLVVVLLFEADVRHRFEHKKINLRQLAIIKQLLVTRQPMALDQLRSASWYLALYAKRTDKTRQRDVRRLREQGLLHIDKGGRLWPGFVAMSEE